MSKNNTNKNRRLIDVQLTSSQLKEIEVAAGTPIKGISIEQIMESSELNKIDRGLLTASKLVVCW